MKVLLTLLACVVQCMCGCDRRAPRPGSLAKHSPIDPGPEAKVSADAASSETPTISPRREPVVKDGVRINYEQSCHFLIKLGYFGADDFGGGHPVVPSRRPTSDDDLHQSIHFFRTWIGTGRPNGAPADFQSDSQENELEDLTLPRTFIGRCELSRISFKNTSLSESTLCWNDFIEVNFADADMSSCDLRASSFINTSFSGTNLQNADLRLSAFENCDFTGADLRGAKLTRKQGRTIRLSDDQLKAIDWQASDGDAPPGG